MYVYNLLTNMIPSILQKKRQKIENSDFIFTKLIKKNVPYVLEP